MNGLARSLTNRRVTSPNLNVGSLVCTRVLQPGVVCTEVVCTSVALCNTMYQCTQEVFLLLTSAGGSTQMAPLYCNTQDR